MNDKGLALITMMFMLLILISAVFLTGYLAVPEQRSDALRFLTKMDVKRFERGVLGRLADQSGGEYMAGGGLLSERGVTGGAASWHSKQLIPLGRRLYGTFLMLNGWFSPENPDWRYDQCGFWKGYRGKRYVQPFPCDDWDEERFWGMEGAYSPGERLRVFLTPLGGINFGFQCAMDYNLSVGGDYRVIIGGHTHNYIRIKDYSPERERHKDHLDIRLLGTNNNHSNPDDHVIEDKGDYILHTFRFSYTDAFGRSTRLSLFGGQRKVAVQIDGQTRFTKSIVIPPYSSFKNRGEEDRAGSVMIDIDYWG